MININEILEQAKKNHQTANIQNAVKLYLQIMEYEPDNLETCQLLGIAVSQLNNHSQAIHYLKKSIEINPDNPTYYINLGEALLRNGDINGSIDNFYYSIKLAPNLLEGHFNLANALKMNRNFSGAIEHYQKAIRINPNHLKSYNGLANTYLKHANFSEAAEIFNQVLQLNPGDSDALRNLEFIQNNLKVENLRINDFKSLNTFSKILPDPDDNELITNYLELLKKCLTGSLHLREDSEEQMRINEGLSWPLYAETMIGIKRLNNLHYCIRKVIKNKIPGDFIETGVWKGGATILMRGILKAYGIKNRKVWVADSFEGLPAPNEELYPNDKNAEYHTKEALKISLEEVQENFKKYNLLDDRVKFLKGWFKDTLPKAPINLLSVLRLDGDMYESTMDGLNNLYHKLSVGGYIIIDDWGAINACYQAVEDFRKRFNITEKIERIDHTGVYWQKLNQIKLL